MSDGEYDAEEMEEILEELEEKEEQLRLAAEFGQTLLERTEELQEENEAMEREKEEIAQKFQDTEYRLQELADNTARLADEADAKDAELAATRKALEDKEAAMAEQLAQLSGGNAEAEAQIKDTKAQMERERKAAAAQVAELQKQSEEIKERETDMREARELEEKERIAAQKAKREMEKQLQAAEGEMARQREQMTAELAKMEVEQQKATEMALEAERKNQSLMDMQNKLAEMERQLAMANETSVAMSQQYSGGVSQLELDGGGGSLFDDMPTPEAAAPNPMSEGVPPSHATPSPKSLDKIKADAETKAVAAAQKTAQAELEAEKARLRQEFETRMLAAQQEATAAAAAEAAANKTEVVEVDTAAIEAKLKQEMEAKYATEKSKSQAAAQEQMANDYKQDMEVQLAAMKKQAAEEMEAQLKAAQRAKEYEMRVKQLTKALGVNGKVDKSAVAAVQKLNVDIMSSADALRSGAAKALDEETRAAAKADIEAAKQKIKQPQDTPGKGKGGKSKKVSGKSVDKKLSRVDANTVAKTGAVVASSVFANLSKLSDAERDEMMGHLTVLKSGAATIAEDDQAIGEKHLKLKAAVSVDQQEGAGPNEISSLVQDAQLIAGTVKSPDDVMRALNENEEFVKAVKKVVCDYVRSAIVGAEIPTIEATKDWGEYTIAELQVVDLDLDPEKLELLVKQSVHVKVRGLNAKFSEFAWQLTKHTFPSLDDEGKGEASMDGLSVEIIFDITSDDDTGELGIMPKPALVELQDLTISVKDCKHEWILNKLLGWFKKSVKQKTLAEIQLQAENKVEEFGGKMTNLMKML